MAAQQATASAVDATERLYALLNEDPENVGSQITLARNITELWNETTSMIDGNMSQDIWTWMISAVQEVAYHDADSGGLRDLADWCVSQWLAVLERHPESVASLKGTPSPSLFRPSISSFRIHVIATYLRSCTITTLTED